jgi:hypothetical protein
MRGWWESKSKVRSQNAEEQRRHCLTAAGSTDRDEIPLIAKLRNEWVRSVTVARYVSFRASSGLDANLSAH